ncbi:hypothetical protein ASF96_02965 [Microbacterium sp. Leaf179]|nr:hypothetical protein ASF96_02965 [Microbacterium sp. Leaf179]
MLCDDIDWISSMAQAGASTEASGMLGLVHLQYFARVTHEGMQLAKRQRPVDAKKFELVNAEVVAAARHSTKLLDDSHKDLDQIVAEFDAIRLDHRRHFGPLLSVVTADGRLITSSRTFSYQTRWPLDKAMQAQGKNNPHYIASYEMGQKLASISIMFGHHPRLYELDSRSIAPDLRMKDANTSEFAASHLGKRLPVSVADVLIMTQASINSALIMLEPARIRFESQVFRARFVALAHALSAIEQVLSKWGRFVNHSSALEEVLASPEAIELRSMRALRNRSMHYGAPASLKNLGPRQIGYGLVEATCPGRTFRDVEEKTTSVLRRLSDAFGDVSQ